MLQDAQRTGELFDMTKDQHGWQGEQHDMAMKQARHAMLQQDQQADHHQWQQGNTEEQQLWQRGNTEEQQLWERQWQQKQYEWQKELEAARQAESDRQFKLQQHQAMKPSPWTPRMPIRGGGR